MSHCAALQKGLCSVGLRQGGADVFANCAHRDAAPSSAGQRGVCDHWKAHTALRYCHRDRSVKHAATQSRPMPALQSCGAICAVLLALSNRQIRDVICTRRRRVRRPVAVLPSLHGRHRHLCGGLPFAKAADRDCTVRCLAQAGRPLAQSRHGDLASHDGCSSATVVGRAPSARQPTAGRGSGEPEVRVGTSHVLPANQPEGTGSVHSRMSTVATISLSATGSRKAPKGVLASCGPPARGLPGCGRREGQHSPGGVRLTQARAR